MTLPTLDGFSVGITADRRWEEQAELLRRRGATVLHGPTIKTYALGPEDGLRRATDAMCLRPPDVLIANTGIGMRSWFAAAESWGVGDALIGALGEAYVVARGPKASGAVHQAGLTVDAISENGRLREVVELVLEFGVEGKTVAFQCHGDDAPDVVAALEDGGALVESIPVYEWRIPQDHRAVVRLIDAVVDGRLHAVTFTSAPAVRNLIAIAQEHDRSEALLHAFNSTVLVACVGPVCAEVAIDVGIKTPIVPVKARIGPLILELAEALMDRAVTFDTLGHAVMVCGATVIIDGESMNISDREARLIAYLIRHVGAVVTKSELLKEVWGSTSADPHVVEVTIGRLRKRLGPCGRAIVTVPRRGYRFEANVAAAP